MAATEDGFIADLGDLKPEESVTIIFTSKALSAGTIVNDAEANTASNPDEVVRDDAQAEIVKEPVPVKPVDPQKPAPDQPVKDETPHKGVVTGEALAGINLVMAAFGAIMLVLGGVLGYVIYRDHKNRKKGEM